MNLDTDLIPLTEVNSKWFIDLNIQHKTTKFLADNIGEYLGDLGFADDLLDTTPKA